MLCAWAGSLGSTWIYFSTYVFINPLSFTRRARRDGSVILPFIRGVYSEQFGKQLVCNKGWEAAWGSGCRWNTSGSAGTRRMRLGSGSWSWAGMLMLMLMCVHCSCRVELIIATSLCWPRLRPSAAASRPSWAGGRGLKAALCDLSVRVHHPQLRTAPLRNLCREGLKWNLLSWASRYKLLI